MKFFISLGYKENINNKHMFQRDMMVSSGTGINIPGLLPDNTNKYYPSMFPERTSEDPFQFRPNWGKQTMPAMSDPYNDIKQREASRHFEELIAKHFKKSEKSAFEQMIDLLFQPEEKIDFLVSLGWVKNDDHPVKPTVSKKDEHGKVILTGEVDQTFLYEITIKFKNLLLAKPKLTVKI